MQRVRSLAVGVRTRGLGSLPVIEASQPAAAPTTGLRVLSTWPVACTRRRIASGRPRSRPTPSSVEGRLNVCCSGCRDHAPDPKRKHGATQRSRRSDAPLEILKPERRSAQQRRRAYRRDFPSNEAFSPAPPQCRISGRVPAPACRGQKLHGCPREPLQSCRWPRCANYSDKNSASTALKAAGFISCI